MGEAPAFIANGFVEDKSNGVDLKSKGHQATICVGDKIYVIGRTENEPRSTMGVQIFDKSRNGRVIPIVLGMNPEPSEGHSAVLFNDDRILVIKGNTSSDDSFWFLEINTPFIKEQRKKLGKKVVAWSKGVLGYAGKPIVISGPSGVGKGTLISMLMEEFPQMFGFSVSHTTRAPRYKEQNGVHYHFTERSVMENEIEDMKFLEFASVHGNIYGTSVEAVEVVADAGKRCILDIDVQGARSVRASPLEAIFIFICPPSFDKLEERLRARATETEEQIQKRLNNARTELEQGKSPGLFDHILINDDLEQCYANLKELLGIHEDGIALPKSSAVSVELPMDHMVSKIDQKILINCDPTKQGKSSEKMLVLDLSSLKGGAPGRTRALYLHFVQHLEDVMNA